MLKYNLHMYIYNMFGTWFLWSGKSQGILHFKVGENSEGRGKSSNLKVPECKG